MGKSAIDASVDWMSDCSLLATKLISNVEPVLVSRSEFSTHGAKESTQSLRVSGDAGMSSGPGEVIIVD